MKNLAKEFGDMDWENPEDSDMDELDAYGEDEIFVKGRGGRFDIDNRFSAY